MKKINFFKILGVAIIIVSSFYNSKTVYSFNEEQKEELANVINIVFTNSAFATLKDGNVITWGSKRHGGDPNYEDNDTAKAKKDLTNVISIVATQGAFAAIKKYKNKNGEEKTTVITWGDKKYGGDPNYEDNDTAKAKKNLTNVISIVATRCAFAAIKKYKDENGEEKTTVITWGNKSDGGDPHYEDRYTAKAKEDFTNVTSIVATDHAFAALKDGKVITWGQKNSGGDPDYKDQNTATAKEDLNNVTDIVTTWEAFAALKKYKDENGEEKTKVITWGSKKHGGDPDYEDIDTAKANKDLTDVTSIVATCGAFAALKKYKDENRKEKIDVITCWGAIMSGGDPRYEGYDPVHATQEDLTNLTSIVTTKGAFAVLKDGKVITWGFRILGGDPNYEDRSVSKATKELTDVTSIVATYGTFVVLKKYKDENGKEKTDVITWGKQIGTMK